MAGRREEKEARRQERLARERQAQAQAARRRRLYGMAVGGVLVLAAIGAIIAVATTGGGGSSGSEAAFGQHYGGLEDRVTAASVPTMAQAATAGAAHFHPHLAVYVNGKRVEIPANIGIDPGRSPSDMAGLHTHDTSGTIHNEAGTGSTLSQFFSVWGVPFSSNQLGTYRVTKRKRVRMWVDGRPSKAFGGLQLKDGQQIVVTYGRSADLPPGATG